MNQSRYSVPVYPSQLDAFKIKADQLATAIADTQKTKKLSAFKRNDYLAQALGYKGHTDLVKLAGFRKNADIAETLYIFSCNFSSMLIKQYLSDKIDLHPFSSHPIIEALAKEFEPEKYSLREVEVKNETATSSDNPFPFLLAANGMNIDPIPFYPNDKRKPYIIDIGASLRHDLSVLVTGIDLNTPSNITAENVALLLASKDDSKHRQIRVSKKGIATLSDDVGNKNTEGVIFRIETFCAGNGYTGAEAAKDDHWVGKVTKCLKEKGLGQEDSYCDMF